MSETVRVTSFDAIKQFQEALAIFCAEAKDALLAVDMESRRVLDWVSFDQLHHWRRVLSERQEELAEAKAALSRKQISKISGQDPDCIEEKEAIWEAKRRLEEAEDKLEKCRQWGRLVQRGIEEYQAPSQQLAALVEGQPARSLVVLGQVLESLDAYAGLSPALDAGVSESSVAAPAPVSAAKPPASS
jgi:hypothetical protein